MKVPTGVRMWPAFWMMPTESKFGIWPTSGELDIMDILGNNATELLGSTHFGLMEPYTQTQGIYSDGTDFSQDFHVFALERDEHEMRWYVDDYLHKTVRDTDENFWNNTPYDGAPPSGKLWPFDEQFHVILNLAVGGQWPGDPDESIKQAQLVLDYVRVYE